MVAVSALPFIAPIPQPVAYHDFADRRAWLGMPNAGDVLSNLPFALVGAVGFVCFLRRRSGAGTALITRAERTLHLYLCVGLVLTAIGSAYYHWAPDTPRLYWDRLPIALVFATLTAITLAERVSPLVGARTFTPLAMLAGGTVWWWRQSEIAGAGDLRAYVLSQFLPLIVLPILILGRRPRYTASWHVLLALAWYVPAKLCEHFDRGIFALTGEVISGHTLKHLFIAVALGWYVAWVMRRRPGATVGASAAG